MLRSRQTNDAKINWKRGVGRFLALFVERQSLTTLGSISPNSKAASLEGPVGVSTRNPLLEHKPSPLNAPGPFYSIDEGCLACGAPHAASPELMAWGEGECSDCFFRRQPQTRKELKHAVRAMEVSCVANLRYGGDDRVVLRTLSKLGLRNLCDAFDE